MVSGPLLKEYELTVEGSDGVLFEVICSPGSLKELAAGRFVSSGAGDFISFIEFHGNYCYVEYEKKNVIRSGKTTVERGDIFRIVSEVPEKQIIHQLSGSSHSCALYFRGSFMALFEDIGRYNTLDKAIGYALLQGLDFRDCVLVYTGRIMKETIKKRVIVE